MSSEASSGIRSAAHRESRGAAECGSTTASGSTSPPIRQPAVLHLATWRRVRPPAIETARWPHAKHNPRTRRVRTRRVLRQISECFSTSAVPQDHQPDIPRSCLCQGTDDDRLVLSAREWAAVTSSTVFFPDSASVIDPEYSHWPSARSVSTPLQIVTSRRPANRRNNQGKLCRDEWLQQISRAKVAKQGSSSQRFLGDRRDSSCADAATFAAVWQDAATDSDQQEHEPEIRASECGQRRNLRISQQLPKPAHEVQQTSIPFMVLHPIIHGTLRWKDAAECDLVFVSTGSVN